jgi:D-alanyl-D-alanine carboxypeptidase/D-alanyl-D-alanine carboxypeptidase (penicillin-binding protein 5/6)
MKKYKIVKSIFSYLVCISILFAPIIIQAAEKEIDLAAALPSDSSTAKKNAANAQINSAAAPITPSVFAASALVIDSERGQALFKKQQDKRLNCRVANKIMTSLLVIENVPLETVITISKENSSVKDSSFILEAGGKYSVEELLYALMLVSSNQSANALGDNVGGGLSKFVGMMNKKASELGMKNTHFSNASGEYADDQYTTAYDISLLIKYALKNSSFQHYFFSTKARPWLTEGNANVLVNQNNLFWIYDGVTGGTLGYNDPSLQSEVTLAQKGGQSLIAIVLDSAAEKVSKDSIDLLDYGFNNFRRDILVEKDKSLRTINIKGKTVNLASNVNVYYTFPIGEDHIKSLEFIDKDFELPVKKDFSLSTARYVLKDDTIIEVTLYPDVEISAPAGFLTVLSKKLTSYKDILILLVFLVFLELIIVIYRIGRFVKRLFISPDMSSDRKN